MKLLTSLLIIPTFGVAVLSGCTQPSDADADSAGHSDVTEASKSSPAAAPGSDTAAAAAPATPAQTGTYTLDPAHTIIQVQWNHFHFSNPSAVFAQVSGTVNYNAQDVSKSSVDVAIPLSGMTAFSPELDQHLRSAEFFNADQYPSAHFKSVSVAPAGTNQLTVTGDLTVRDQTKPIQLNVTINGAGNHPMKKTPTIGFDATTTLKRSDFGVGAFAPSVSDAVQVRITTEGSMTADAAGASTAK